MNLEKPLRELSATEILDRSIILYSQRLLEFFAPFFFGGVLNGVMRHVVGFLLPPTVLPQTKPERFFQWLTSYLYLLAGASSALAVSFWIITTITSGIAIKYASDLLEKGDANLAKAFNFTIYKLAPLLAAGLISGVLVVLGLVLFVIPGIIVALIFSLAVPVIIIEDRGVFESLERSRRLVDRSWWKTFAVLLLVLIVTAFFGIIGEAIGIFFGPFRDLASALAAAFIQPIYPLSLTLFYYSMRIKEAQPFQQVGYKPPVAPVRAEQARFCIYCGQILPPDALFCPKCGNRIERYS